MTLDQLEILAAIVETGSFRAAADKLWKTQPAISIAVKKLESELKIELFERSHKTTRLTQKGERIFEEAQQLLRGSKRLRDLSRYLSSENEPYIKLAVDVVCPLDDLLPALRSFFDDYKQTRLDLSFEVLGGVTEQLEKDSAHMVISSIDSNEVKLERRPIWQIEMVPVCAPGYLNLTESGYVKEEDLREHNQIVISETNESRSSKQTLLDGAHKWQVSSLEIKYKLLLAGMGWGSLPLYRIEDDLQTGKLVRLHSKTMKPIQVPFYLSRRQDKLHGKVATSLWQHLLEAFI